MSGACHLCQDPQQCAINKICAFTPCKPPFPTMKGDFKHSRLLELRDKIEAVGKAYDLEYDGDEGPRGKAVQDAGIDLDDFVMVHAGELTSLLDALLEVAPSDDKNGDLVQRLRKADVKYAECTAHAGPHTILGEAANVIEALAKAYVAEREELLKARRSATRENEPLVVACRALVSYWTRNLLNFQWEKADDHVKRINAALPEYVQPCTKCGKTPPFPGGTRCQDLECPLINWAGRDGDIGERKI